MSKMLRRVLTVIPAAAVQALWILLLVKWLSPYAAYITLALSVAAGAAGAVYHHQARRDGV